MFIAFKKIGLILVGLMVSACAYKYPTMQYEASSNPIENVGIYIGINKELPTADQPSTSYAAAFGAVGGLIEGMRYKNAEEASAAFGEALEAVDYQPREELFNRLSSELGLRGIQSKLLETTYDTRNKGGVRFSLKAAKEAASRVEEIDAILLFNFVNWGFSSKRDEKVMKPYMFFNVMLLSPDGEQTYLEDVIQFNDVDFKGIKTTILVGDDNQTFEQINDLISSPELAVQYLNKTWDSIANEIGLRLRQN